MKTKIVNYLELTTVGDSCEFEVRTCHIQNPNNVESSCGEGEFVLTLVEGNVKIHAELTERHLFRLKDAIIRMTKNHKCDNYDSSQVIESGIVTFESLSCSVCGKPYEPSVKVTKPKANKAKSKK
jgi:hypothetical protein